MTDELDTLIGAADTVRSVFEQAPLMLIGLDGPEHRVAAANSAYRTLFGRENIVGVPVRDVFPEVLGQQTFEMMDHVYQTGEPQIAREWRLQIDLRQTGQLQDFYIDFVATPLRDPAGTITGLVFAITDVTDQALIRIAAQTRAAEAEQQYAQARDVITALQRQLLPAGLPVLPSVRVAGSYLLADAEDDAGGDWFDAIPLEDGRVALVVGDVVGHGVAASATMGQLRAVVHERLDATGDPVAALAAADRMTRRIPGVHAATVCVAVLDPVEGAVSWCSAGHPPPLVINAEAAHYFAAPEAGPLGTGASYAVATDRLGAGEVILLYSDGIIERPGREPAAATVELAQVAADAVADRGLRDADLSAVDRASIRPLELLVRRTGHVDDITLLAAQRQVPAEDLALELPAGVAEIAAARVVVAQWLEQIGAGAPDAVAIQHAVVELVTNAAEHSHPDTPTGTVRITAGLDATGTATLTVADRGRWRERARPGSAEFRSDGGLGLAMTKSFVDDLAIDRQAEGTTVVVRHRLSHPARLLTAARITGGAPRPPREVPELMLILDQPTAPSPRVAIHGTLDATNATELADELNRRTLGGTHQLIVDLAAVTHLASAAVAVFHRSAGSLRLYAPLGSVAHHVLTLVDLAHATTDPDQSTQA